jgi:putative FmdB family regulatory protein
MSTRIGSSFRTRHDSRAGARCDYNPANAWRQKLMPIYGYVCRNCEHTLDVLQKISDDPLVDCPECGEPQLRRQLSAPRFRLKGKGWYETDFKKDKQRNLHGDKEPSKKDDPKKDDKPAAKTEKKADTRSASDSTSKTG